MAKRKDVSQSANLIPHHGLKKNQVYLYDNNNNHFQNLVLFIVQ
jgi:hypothetical protein